MHIVYCFDFMRSQFNSLIITYSYPVSGVSGMFSIGYHTSKEHVYDLTLDMLQFCARSSKKREEHICIDVKYAIVDNCSSSMIPISIPLKCTLIGDLLL